MRFGEWAVSAMYRGDAPINKMYFSGSQIYPKAYVDPTASFTQAVFLRGHISPFADFYMDQGQMNRLFFDAPQNAWTNDGIGPYGTTQYSADPNTYDIFYYTEDPRTSGTATNASVIVSASKEYKIRDRHPITNEYLSAWNTQYSELPSNPSQTYGNLINEYIDGGYLKTASFSGAVKMQTIVLPGLDLYFPSRSFALNINLSTLSIGRRSRVTIEDSTAMFQQTNNLLALPKINEWMKDNESIGDDFMRLAGYDGNIYFQQARTAGVRAFYQAPNITSINLPRLQTLGSLFSADATSVEELILPSASNFANGNTNYFNGMTSLERIELQGISGSSSQHGYTSAQLFARCPNVNYLDIRNATWNTVNTGEWFSDTTVTGGQIIIGQQLQDFIDIFQMYPLAIRRLVDIQGWTVTVV